MGIYKAGNIYDKQRMSGRGFDQSLSYSPQGAAQFKGTPAEAMQPDSQFRPEGGGGGMSGMDIAGLASYAPMIAGDLMQAFKNPEYDTGVQGGDRTGYNPKHGLGDELARAHSINTDNWIGQSVGSNALKFAGTGASIGGVLGPVGGLIGAGVGGLVGAVTGFFGGKKKKKSAEKQRNQLLANVGKQAEEFSETNIKAKSEQQAKRIALQQYS